MVQVRVEGLESEVLPVVGVLGETLLEAIAGGQAVALTHRGRADAVVVDVETYAELVGATQPDEGAAA